MITASISGKKSGNAEELPGASVLVVRRNDLFLRVHHEGTAGYDRLAERLAREDDGAHAVSAARQRNDALLVGSRSEERRVGKACVSTCRSRWSPHPYKKTLPNTLPVMTHMYLHTATNPKHH